MIECVFVSLVINMVNRALLLNFYIHLLCVRYVRATVFSSASCTSATIICNIYYAKLAEVLSEILLLLLFDTQQFCTVTALVRAPLISFCLLLVSCEAKRRLGSGAIVKRNAFIASRLITEQLLYWPNGNLNRKASC